MRPIVIRARTVAPSASKFASLDLSEPPLSAQQDTSKASQDQVRPLRGLHLLAFSPCSPGDHNVYTQMHL